MLVNKDEGCYEIISGTSANSVLSDRFACSPRRLYENGPSSDVTQPFQQLQLCILSALLIFTMPPLRLSY